MNQRDALILLFRTSQIDRTNPEDPFSTLPWEDIDLLFSSMAGDIIRTVSQLTTIDILVYRNTKEVSDDFFFPFHQRMKLMDLEPIPPAEQIRQGIENAYAAGYQNVAVMLQNHPLITKKTIADLFSQLGYEDDCIVVGPTNDNRGYLVGMKMNHSEIFELSEGDVLQKQHLLLKNICRLDSMLFLMPPMNSIDHAANLMALMKEVELLDKTAVEYPVKTANAFKALQKKYKLIKNNV
jgi:hypothetical protein